MCGIAGIVNLNGRPVENRRLRSMLRVIHHRGPDDGGYALIDRQQRNIHSFSDEDCTEAQRQTNPVLTDGDGGTASIGLAHRRFSIIDLSAAGHQPFVDDAAGYCLTFNGEIYNYVELRDELIAEGFTDFARSPTPRSCCALIRPGVRIVLSAFTDSGRSQFTMQSETSVLLSRDRLGKKPLYWAKA